MKVTNGLCVFLAEKAQVEPSPLWDRDASLNSSFIWSHSFQSREFRQHRQCFCHAGTSSISSRTARTKAAAPFHSTVSSKQNRA